jgi:hypothetical protein
VPINFNVGTEATIGGADDGLPLSVTTAIQEFHFFIPPQETSGANRRVELTCDVKFYVSSLNVGSKTLMKSLAPNQPYIFKFVRNPMVLFIVADSTTKVAVECITR